MATTAASNTKTEGVFQFLGFTADVLIFVICLTPLGLVIPVHGACPPACSCSAASAGGQTVSCGPGLPSFPQNLPVDTASLSLSPLPSQTQNNIPVISAGNFNSIKDLKWITLRRSNVQKIGPSAFFSLTNLLGLDLRDNKLQSLSRSDLVGLSSLVTLDISDNGRCALNTDTFKGLSRLRVLRLANIGLDTLGGILNDLTSLVHLDLHGNNLFRLRGTSLSRLRNLRHLDVSGNDMYGVDEDAKPVLASLSALDLDLNPWRCNCALTWVKSLPRKFVAPSGGGRMPVVCGQPSRLVFQDVWDVQDLQMTCSPAKVLSCTGPVTVWAGDQISITCDVEGDPFPDITWYRPDGTQVQTDVTFAIADTVSLTAITADYSLHHGAWKVKAVSYNTTASISVQVTVLRLTTQSKIHTTTIPAHSRQPGNHNNQANQGSNNNNKNSTLNPIGRPTLSSRGLPLTYAGGKPVTPDHPASVASGSGNSGGNKPVVPVTSSPGGIQSPKGRTQGSEHDNTTSKNKNKNKNSGKNSNKNDNGNNSEDGGNGIDNNMVLFVAIVCGSLVCIVGMTLFALTVYKIRKKRQIHARRRRQSEDLYRYNWYGNGVSNSAERSNTDVSFFLRPPSATNVDTASTQNVSTMFSTR
ncbi:leucine-rich repeat and fibronectin type-III domain-containing protein 5 [Elysia marginata]|uniref:Leucine-rich repeat and fibronectin type-III domain-containing protein 5 n=1 Tax=Elysia marginata TaxID=1093978 RepID=A0AAV4GNH7_9GAST|nr:leucine-rich repeat and fibronectin type-III domain-containing protein 5 [Elysia marginata]